MGRLAHAGKGMAREKAMERIAAEIGNTVTVEYAISGYSVNATDKLVAIRPFHSVTLDGLEIPFVGKGVAIMYVSVMGKKVYENKAIPWNYNVQSEDEIERYAERSFGRKLAARSAEAKHPPKGVISLLRRNIVNANMSLQIEHDRLTAEGLALVKPELHDAWPNYTMFSHDELLDLIVAVMKALAAGKTPEEARAAMGKLTSSQEQDVVEVVFHFHPRGAEFREDWKMRHFGTAWRSPKAWTWDEKGEHRRFLPESYE